MDEVRRSKEVVGGCDIAVVVVDGEGDGERVRGWIESESSG